MNGLAQKNEASRVVDDLVDQVSIQQGGLEHRGGVYDVLRQGWVDTYTRINLGTKRDPFFASEELVVSVFEDENGDPAQEYFADLERSLTDPSESNRTSVALMAGRVVGFYQLSAEPAVRGEHNVLQKLYVARDVRRHKLGNLMLDEAIEQSPQVLDLKVARGNPAFSFYREAGFRQVGEDKTDYTFEGLHVPLITMRHGSHIRSI
jgi:ribosomal protein S18 acetylase RimI-like enzyme